MTMQSQISSICISFLTQLLDLNSLDELLDVERESYVLTNIRSEFGSKSCEDAILDADRKEKKSHKKLFKSNSKECHHVFGGKLTESSVKVIIKIIEHLKDYTEIEGLFRISGNKRRQEELKDMLNKGLSIDLNDKTYSQHDLSTILKQFFAELSEPLLTNSLYQCYKQVAEMDGAVSSKKRLKALQLLSLMLPPLNRLIFKKLVELLHLVSQKKVNLMTSKNLAVVFAPNIAAKTKISCLNDYNDTLEPLTDIIEFIIENAADVFKVPEEIFNPRQKSRNPKNEDILRMPKVYCQQSDIKSYQMETVKNTNDALAELYTQVVNMPDSNPMKKSFLDDFRKKYPGTPPFTPQCRKLSRIPGSPATSTTPLKRKISEESKFSDSKDELFRKEDAHFLSTPEKKRLFTEGDLADHMTPESIDTDHCNDVPTIELTKEKRRRFRRPSFGRPSFGFLAKRSTPDLRKLRKMSFSSNSKRTRSSSSTEAPEKEQKRRFSFTPFSERRANPQRAMTERRHSKKSNRVSISDSDVRKNNGNEKNSEDIEMDHFQCSRNTNVRNEVNDMSSKTPKAKPELRAPLMNIKSISKPMMPAFSNPRRETLAVNKEQTITIDAYRPRRETLAVHREPPAIVPLKPRRENFFFENKGEPVLESFKPKRDSLLIHKKIQPQKEMIQCVKKQIYSDIENIDPCVPRATEPRKDSHGKARDWKQPWQHHRQEGDWTQEFSTFGKSSIGPVLPKKDSRGSDPFHHARRMSTGSIATSALTRMRTWDEGFLVTYL